MDDNELFVCLPGSFVEVGAILVVKLCFTWMKSKFECKMFSLFDKQFSGFLVKSSSTMLSKLRLKKDLRSHDDAWLEEVEVGDDDLKKRTKKLISTFCKQKSEDRKLN